MNAPRYSQVRQQGVALIIVLWMGILLAVVVGSFAIVARTETLQTTQQFDGLKGRFLAEAAIHRAAYELRRPTVEERWLADGRKYEFKIDDADIAISVIDESGKIDINLANEDLLERLFASAGIADEEELLQLVDAIMDWRDPDDLTRLNGAEDDDYEAAEFPYGSKDAPFDTAAELQQVMGMNYELFQKVENAITVHGGRPVPDPTFAQADVLQAFDGVDSQTAADFVADREQITELGVPLPVLPDGTSPVTRSGGYTFTVKSRATMPSGIWSEIDATIRMGGAPGEPPFRVLRWNES